ncbi:membrane protein insertion efficiency factor YidD [Pseudofrancisella aestuarii]|uniref:Putative membrane protein insertion efficiency factor n=1 Tax=Pseudofrancisella aestuarii TaxID=2670347 RepID=A0ABV9TB64_9GAMM|nr:membrane protein insertion efficiency factor YidD [Pseudofrancisella aestuarii]
MGIYRKILSNFRKVKLIPFVFLIKFYQYIISPVLPARCRYYPTCSEYALEAFKTHGVVRGGWLSAVRLAKCHPLCKRDYYDPVPVPKNQKGQK